MRDAASSTAVDADDTAHMRRALALAERGWGQTAPNPMVGAVVVAAGAVVGEGYHARYGDAHGEAMALRHAGDRARGATLYVTLEPCVHYGKTPPCADAVIAAGITRVVIAVRDPSDVARGGVERLRAAGIAVDIGVEHARAVELNAAFFNAHASDRPWVTLKLAMSADGAIADPAGVHRWITGPAARAEGHRMRANADAVAVGVGTVLADDPSLTVRDAPVPRVPPRRIIFDRRLRTPLDAVLVRTAVEIPTSIIAVSAPLDASALNALVAAGVEVSWMPSLRVALQALPAKGIRALLVEGGAQLAGAFLRDSLVDRLTIFRSPLVLGENALKAFAFAAEGFESSLHGRPIVAEQRFGDDRMTTYALRDVPCLPD